ncbi:uncharacterized protein FYW61_014136 [Anableps anableps]
MSTSLIVFWEKLKSAAKMELWKIAASFIYAFLFDFCCAVDLECTVKRNGTRIIHTISFESHASDFHSARCDASWSNTTTVLSTSFDKHVTETTNSLHTLETSECHAYILWMGQCWSERTGLKDYTANCSTTCSVMNLHQDDKVNPKVGDSDNLIKLVFGFLSLLGLLGLILLSYKFRGNICSMFTIVRRLYTPVPRENDPEQAKVLNESG